MPTIDMDTIRARAMLIRDVRQPADKRSDAALEASDDLLLLLAEVERLQAALSPESAEIARRLDAMSLFPISDKGPRYDLHCAIEQSLTQWVLDNRPRRGQKAMTGASVFSQALKIARLVNNYFDRYVRGATEPASKPGEKA